MSFSQIYRLFDFQLEFLTRSHKRLLDVPGTSQHLSNIPMMGGVPPKSPHPENVEISGGEGGRVTME